LSTMLLSLVCCWLPVGQAAETLDRVYLVSGESYVGVVLVHDDRRIIIETLSPEGDQTRVRRFGLDELTAVEPAGPPSSDWLGPWRAFRQQHGRPEADKLSWRTESLVRALDQIEQGHTRAAFLTLRALNRQLDDRERNAVNELLELHPGRSLEQLLAELQVRDAFSHARVGGFRLTYRPTTEDRELARRLTQLYERLLSTPVPQEGEPEDFEGFLEPPPGDGAAPGNPPDAAHQASSEHSVTSWLDRPADYDGLPEAARHMLRRLSFALSVLRERLVLAGTGRGDEPERRQVLAARRRLFELAAAVRSRAAGNPTPAEREQMRRVYLAELERQWLEEERLRMQHMHRMFPRGRRR